jgi:hypothetical protein
VILAHWPGEPECGRPRQTGRQVVTGLGLRGEGSPDPNCKGATEKIDATDRPPTRDRGPVRNVRRWRKWQVSCPLLCRS